MKQKRSQQKAERDGWQRAAGQAHMILPRALPLERPTLAYLQLYYQDVFASLQEPSLEQWAKASVQAQVAPNEQDSRHVAIATHCQKRYLLEHCQIKYVHSTALKMGEALLAPDNRAPAFPPTPVWLHPLAPLVYRGEQVRALFLYRPYDLSVFDHNPYLTCLHPQTRRWCRDFFLPFADRREVVIVSETPVEQGSRVTIHPFAEYTTFWKGVDACPSCTFEVLGEERVCIPCPACREEVDYWTRWLKTMLWVVSGRFRQPRDQQELELHREEIVVESASSGKKRTSFTGEIVRYDASYFRSAPRHERRPGKCPTK
jgi:hypothetical protein